MTACCIQRNAVNCQGKSLIAHHDLNDSAWQHKSTKLIIQKHLAKQADILHMDCIRPSESHATSKQSAANT